MVGDCQIASAMLIANSALERKEGHMRNYYLRFYRPRGPIVALQMRLQG